MSRSEPIDRAIAGLIDAGRDLGQRGFLPATSGNLSCRVSHDQIAITASGGDKGHLCADDILIVDIAAPPHSRSSAETPLHLQLYRDRPETGAVLHGHSMWSTLVSQAQLAASAHTPREASDERGVRGVRSRQAAVVLSGYELLKAFAGVGTHETHFEVPLFPNDQDMDALARTVAARLSQVPAAVCYLLAGHGFYAWGRSMAEARRHVEALDFLLACEWEKSKLAATPPVQGFTP